MEGSGQLCVVVNFILREGCTISNWIEGQVVFGTSMAVGPKSHRLYTSSQVWTAVVESASSHLSLCVHGELYIAVSSV